MAFYIMLVCGAAVLVGVIFRVVIELGHHGRGKTQRLYLSGTIPSRHTPHPRVSGLGADRGSVDSD